jgi:RHS repeat-associated protein
LKNAVAVCSTDASRRYAQAYTYDLSGNMSSKTGIGGWAVQSWQGGNQHIRPIDISYNKEVAGVANRTIEYNQDNMPIHITYAGGTQTDLSYDGDGYRVKKVQGSSTVIYLGDIYEIRDGQPTSYIYANGQKIVTITGGNQYYTHSDHLGSTSLTTNTSGVAIEEIGYLPFGSVLFRKVYNGGAWVSVYKFTGQEFDSEYELYNYNARLYDPVMGRFITPDTMIPDPYNPQSLNRYAYCLNNPLRYTDPSGHEGEDDEIPIEDIEDEAQRQVDQQAAADQARRNGSSDFAYSTIIPSIADFTGVAVDTVAQMFAPNSAYAGETTANSSDSSGVLTIYSNGGKKITSGHSWLSYTPNSTGEKTTYGTFGNRNPNGLYMNVEIDDSAEASRSMNINAAQENIFYSMIQKYQAKGDDAWGYLNPCSSFAADVWNAVTGESLAHQAYFIISNPTTLRDSIIMQNSN